MNLSSCKKHTCDYPTVGIVDLNYYISSLKCDKKWAIMRNQDNEIIKAELYAQDAHLFRGLTVPLGQKINIETNEGRANLTLRTITYKDNGSKGMSFDTILTFYKQDETIKKGVQA